MLHVILTRFNVRSSGRERSLREQPEWLQHRFDLFDRFCFPSVAAQTVSDFTWLVFFDAATPEPFRSRIERYRELRSLIPVFVDDWQTEIVHDAIRRCVRPGETELLTTRLDNDDALHAEFIARLRVEATAGGPGFYNFPHGLIYRQGHLYRHADYSNPFASLLEPLAGFSTVWKVRHNAIHRTQAARQIEMPHAWLQVIHGANVSNRVRGVRVLPDAVEDGYRHLADVPFRAGNPLLHWLDVMLLSRARAQRDGLRLFVKRTRNRARNYWRRRHAPAPQAEVPASPVAAGDATEPVRTQA